MTRSDNPARRTPSRDFFFGFSGGGPPAGAGAELVDAVSSGGGTMRESELVAGGSKDVVGSAIETGGVGGIGGGSTGVVFDGGCVFD